MTTPLRTTDLAVVTGRVAGLDETTPFETILAALEAISAIRERLAELKREADEAAVHWLLRNGGELVVGECRYYAAPDREHKPLNLRDVAEAVMAASGGDWERFVGCLSAGAFKPGAVRKLLEEAGKPAAFADLFTTIERYEVREGKPARPRLQKVDTKFLPR